MSILKRLRGEPKFSTTFLGQTLTFYRLGVPRGLLVAVATFIAFNLPWYLISAGGETYQLLTTVIGCYVAATLMASRAPAQIDGDNAAIRWL